MCNNYHLKTIRSMINDKMCVGVVRRKLQYKRSIIDNLIGKIVFLAIKIRLDEEIELNLTVSSRISSTETLKLYVG